MSDRHAAAAYEERAETLGRTLPALLLDAERMANTIALGVHGRRRSGMGETFWQFRRFHDGDSPTAIDWRKSARSHSLFVRENEWEAAGTVWLWMNRSPTMAFRSHLSPESKAERAMILLLALAILLVRGGERIGGLGATRGARSDRHSVPRIAEALATPALTEETAPSLPPEVEVSRFSSLVLFSDFLEPVEEIHARIAPFANREVRGHLVQILDPAEETFPFTGRLEFRDVLGSERLIIGRSERLREEYCETLARHRLELQGLAQRLGWSFTVHHTDAAPTNALLALFAMLSGEVGISAAPDLAVAEAP